MDINPGKNFFRNKGERDLWIRLNAERIQYRNKMLNSEEQPFGSISEPQSCMWISGNQLVYDEHCRESPRFSFEELLLTREELFRLEIKREEEEQKKRRSKVRLKRVLADGSGGNPGRCQKTFPESIN